MPTAKRISTDAGEPSGPGRFVLGFGGALDHELVWDGALIERLASTYGLRMAECTVDQPIVDERSLLAVILGHAIASKGGERFVSDPAVLWEFSSRHNRAVTIGGTDVRAALIMRTLGVRSTVVLVGAGSAFLERFPPDCDYLLSDADAELVPHLIVQLPASGSVGLVDGEVVIDRPNRLIFVNDPPNLTMDLPPDLGPALATADVLLISGFNAMRDAALLRRRLFAVAALPLPPLVMYEDAGYHSDEVRAAAHDLITPIADVFSMNEDELQAYVSRDVDLLDPTAVLDALGELHELFPGPTLVVHTRHWALASGGLASSLEPALSSGIRAATARYLHGDAVTDSDVDAIGRWPVPSEHLAFASAVSDGDVRCVPAYTMHIDNPTTIGLGDCFVGGFLAALSSERMPA